MLSNPTKKFLSDIFDGIGRLTDALQDWTKCDSPRIVPKSLRFHGAKATQSKARSIFDHFRFCDPIQVSASHGVKALAIALLGNTKPHPPANPIRSPCERRQIN